MNYQIISALTLDQLAAEVKTALNQDWIPVGGPIVFTVDDPNAAGFISKPAFRFSQALLRYGPDKKPPFAAS